MVPDPTSSRLPLPPVSPQRAGPHPSAGAGLLLVGGVLALIASFLPFEWVYSSAPDYPLATPAPPYVYSVAQGTGVLVHSAQMAESLQGWVGYGGLALLAALLLWGVPFVLAALGGVLLVQRRPAVWPRTRRLLRILLVLEFAWFLLYLVSFAIGHALDSQDMSTPQIGAALIVLSYLCAGVGSALLPAATLAGSGH
jgi:hypothetical protein